MEKIVEKAADNYEKTFGLDATGTESVDFIKGAKWAQEKSYSEEEVIKIIQACKSYLAFGDKFNEIEWFNKKFKK